VTDLKSMVSVGLTSLAASKFDMRSVAIGDKQMRVLCIGHGGGSLPLFIAKHILGRNFQCTCISVFRTSICNSYVS
jgi:hypothetical protein